MTSEVERLRRELKDAEKREYEERQALRKATKRQWRFTLDTAHKSHFDRIRPGAGVTIYYLHGEVVNKDECLAVGYSESDLGGGMAYYFNTATHMFAGPTGGGHIFIHDTGGFGSESETYETFRKLEAFLRDNPEGGDVTEIILAQPNFRRH